MRISKRPTTKAPSAAASKRAAAYLASLRALPPFLPKGEPVASLPVLRPAARPTAICQPSLSL